MAGEQCQTPVALVMVEMIVALTQSQSQLVVVPVSQQSPGGWWVCSPACAHFGADNFQQAYSSLTPAPLLVPLADGGHLEGRLVARAMGHVKEVRAKDSRDAARPR